MTHRRLWGLLTGLALALGLLAPAEAADPAVMEAAKKEGKVVWYSSLGLSVAQKVCDAFNKKALGITCELTRDGSSASSRRSCRRRGRISPSPTSSIPPTSRTSSSSSRRTC